MQMKSKILDFKIKKDIYDFISGNPGLHLRELSRLLDISYTNLRHHLRSLDRAGLLSIKDEEGFQRYFAKVEISRKEKEILSVLRHQVPLRIVILLLLCDDFGPINKAMLRKMPDTHRWKKKDYDMYRVFKSRSTLNYHLQRLIDFDIIERIYIDGKANYRIKDFGFVLNLLTKYFVTLDDEVLTDCINFINDIGLNRRIDPFLDIVVEVFPNPYFV